ncbi:MAG: DnaD domain protein [Lachnospiraceae bacterium]|nr:DnaD domain protein [Lachnospiraceae bacterium]
MDNIILCSGNSARATCISNNFIENHMITASGSYVKLYIYLAKCIQCGDSRLSISFLAERMDATERDIVRGLAYWENLGLLQIARTRQGEITAIDMLDCSETAERFYVNVSQKTGFSNQDEGISGKESIESIESVENNYSGKSIDNKYNGGSQQVSGRTEKSFGGNAGNQAVASQADNGFNVNAGNQAVASQAENGFKGDAGNQAVASQTENGFNVNAGNQAVTVRSENNSQDEVVAASEGESGENYEWLCMMVEMFLKKPLSSNDMELINYLYDDLKFKAERIVELYSYCLDREKSNNSYIRKVAISWDKENIHTANEAVEASKAYNKAFNEVARAFGIKRALAPVEQEFVQKWHETYNFDIPVIVEACRRTIMQTQAPKFDYADGIIENWHKSGISSLQDIKNADDNYKQIQKNAKNQSVTRNNKNNGGGNRNSFTSFSQRPMSSEQMLELEKKLLQKTIGGGN